MTDGYFSYYTQATGSYIWPATGGIAYPQQTLQISDPTINAIAAFFSQILQSNLLPRFANECSACGLLHSNLDSFVDGVAVAQTIVFPLNKDLLKIDAFRFPLLAIQPVSETYHNFSLTKLVTERMFNVSWILPPLTPLQYNRLYPFFGMASKALLAFGSQGYDPKVSNISIWQEIGVSFGFMDSVSYEPYNGLNKQGSSVFFPTIELEMSFVERNQDPVIVNFSDDFTEVDLLQIDLHDGYNQAAPITNFIDGYVFPNITIDSCSPATGTVQGNTLVLIKGAGFDPAKVAGVSLDNSPAKQFVVKGPNLIMAISNPSPNFPIYTGSIGPITITDTLNNQYSLPSGFAYSVP
jgi:hypothetical protein